MVWGNRHRHQNSRAFEHAACGTRLSDDRSCPKCRLVPGPEDIVTVPLRGKPVRDDPVALALAAPHRLLEPLET
jgi:hypothetical protein